MNRLISSNARSSFKFFGNGIRSYSTQSVSTQRRGLNRFFVFGGIIGLGATTAAVTYYNNTSLQRVVEGLQRLGTSMWTVGLSLIFTFITDLLKIK